MQSSTLKKSEDIKVISKMRTKRANVKENENINKNKLKSI